MKKIYLFLSIIVTFGGFGFTQTAPKFKLTKDGIKPIVFKLDTSYTDSVIYTKIKEWIALNNKSPKSVTRIDNEYSLIKFSCYSKDGWKGKINGVDYWNELQFTLNVEIKDAKCRVTFASDDTHYKFWYNSDGILMEKFKESHDTFENTVNKQITSLYSYILHGEKPNQDNW